METINTAQHRPLLISAINAAGKALHRDDPDRLWLNTDDLLRTASKKERLEDYGDAGFRQGLDMLADSVMKEARLNSFGRFMEKQNLIRILRNRLRMEEDIRRDPSIESVPMEDPLVIAGLQRTGTTMLQRILASDDRFRFLASWEAINPAPFRKKHRGEDPRVAQARTAQRALRYLSPAFFAIHPVSILDPEEDCLLFDLDFTGTVPEATQRVPTFSRWLETRDHEWSYVRFKRILRYLYSQSARGRWLLKTPQHLEHIEDLFSVFPGATIVQTHRDPVKVIASFCSMIFHGYRIFSDRVDAREIASHWIAKAELMVKRSMDIRRKGGDVRFVDILYTDLMRDPVGEVRRVYARIGIPFTAETEGRILAWKVDNPQHRYGRHTYRLEDYGLEAGMIREKFNRYISEFNIPEE